LSINHRIFTALKGRVQRRNKKKERKRKKRDNAIRLKEIVSLVMTFDIDKDRGGVKRENEKREREREREKRAFVPKVSAERKATALAEKDGIVFGNGGFERLHEIAGASVQPDERTTMEQLAGLGVPSDGAFALVGDPDVGDLGTGRQLAERPFHRV
jgi:hypothetical protein